MVAAAAEVGENNKNSVMTTVEELTYGPNSDQFETAAEVVQNILNEALPLPTTALDVKEASTSVFT